MIGSDLSRRQASVDPSFNAEGIIVLFLFNKALQLFRKHRRVFLVQIHHMPTLKEMKCYGLSLTVKRNSVEYDFLSKGWCGGIEEAGGSIDT